MVEFTKSGADKRYRLGIDIGGTFTDFVLIAPDGQYATKKVLSTPADHCEAILSGTLALLSQFNLQPAAISEIVHATTIGTNAILEGAGARTALITTRGFRDVLELRRMSSPAMYDWNWAKPTPLVERYLRLEVDERIDADGRVIRVPHESEVRELCREVRRLGAESVAVCLLNSYINPSHERLIGAILAEELPGTVICLSCEISPEIEEYERTSTTVANAYVAPLFKHYLDNLAARLATAGIEVPIRIMQSGGGTLSREAAIRRPITLLESGPAAGVVGCPLLVPSATEGSNVLAFDMGGTTSKVAIIENGQPLRAPEFEVGAPISLGSRLNKGGGYTIRTPSIDIAEIGSGGGSIAWVDAGGALKVGPRSSGSVPGPACYMRGGKEPTVTDANLVLGYLNPVALAAGQVELSSSAASHAIEEQVARPLGIPAIDAAYAIHEVASSNMMRAIRSVTVERGRDPKNFTLVSFGGSSAQHIAEIAKVMGIRKVVVPRSAGTFGALGLLYADVEHYASQSVLRRDAVLQAEDLEHHFHLLENQVRVELAEQGYAEVELAHYASIEYEGQTHALTVPVPASVRRDAGRLFAELRRIFEQEYQRCYGAIRPGEPIEVVTLRVIGRVPLRAAPLGEDLTVGKRVSGVRRAYFGRDAGYLDAALVSREDLRGQGLAGPLMVEEPDTSIVVPPGFHAQLDERGDVVINVPERMYVSAEKSSRAGQRRPEQLEILRNRLESIADEMSITILRTAHSSLIRDIKDFGTALLTPKGELAVFGCGLATHVCSIPPAIRATLAEHKDDLKPGDVFILNDPYSGGRHLPDIFLFAPVFHEGRLIAFTATTGHYVDVGGGRPGSVSPLFTEIYQEGLRIPPLKLFHGGKPDRSLFALLRKNVRVPHKVLGDLESQLSAHTVARRQLEEFVAETSVQELDDAFDNLIAYTERSCRAAIAAWPDGEYSFTDFVDGDGITLTPIPICLKVAIQGDEMELDFTGSGAQVPTAINAVRSAVESHAYQVIRCAMQIDIPNNEGVFKPVHFILPPHSILNADEPAAVSANSVATERVRSVVRGALALALPRVVPADGSGISTAFVGGDAMRRSWVMADIQLGTLGGSALQDGPDGLSNPSSLRNASIERSEAEFPVRFTEYSYEQDSGGAGKHRGGLGIRRGFELLNLPATLTVRSDRTSRGPWGIDGGAEGRNARSYLESAGEEKLLPGKTFMQLKPGDRFLHITPSGGGYGVPADRDPVAVLSDWRNGKISDRQAREVYRVAIDEKRNSIDEAGTRALRSNSMNIQATT